MLAAAATVDLEVAERADTALRSKKSMWFTKRWRKWPDAPLAGIVEGRLRRCVQAGMIEPAVAQRLINRVRRRRPSC